MHVIQLTQGHIKFINEFMHPLRCCIFHVAALQVYILSVVVYVCCSHLSLNEGKCIVVSEVQTQMQIRISLERIVDAIH